MDLRATLSKVEHVALNDVHKIENQPSFKKLESGAGRRKFVLILSLITVGCGVGEYITGNIVHFFVEVFPILLLSIILGYLFLKRSDETTIHSTRAIHEALSKQITDLQLQVTANKAAIAANTAEIQKDETSNGIRRED